MSSHPLTPETTDDLFCRICEETGFILPAPCQPAAIVEYPGPHHQASVRLRGKLTGTVQIAASLDAAQAMAAGLLGADDPSQMDEAHAIHVLKELANIAAGVLAGEATSGDGTCRFSVPDHAAITPEHWRTLCRDQASRCFEAMEGPWVLRLVIEGEKG